MWIDPTEFGLPDKGDVVDYLTLYGGDTAEARRVSITCAMDLATPAGASDPLRVRIEDAKSGKLASAPWPGRSLTVLSKALLPGTVTAVCADPGFGKSFFALESFAYWHSIGIKAAAFMLEDGQDYHLNRILAQLEENGDLADIDWIRTNPDVADEAYARHRVKLDAMAPWLDANDEPVDYGLLLDWMERRAAQGCRVLLIDPVTAVPVKDKPWVEDQKFIMRAKQIVRKHGASLVLMTHPRTGKGGVKGSLSDLAGGAAFPRFSHTVLWLDRHDKPKRVEIVGPVGAFVTDVNRTLRMSKTRNGRGAGMALGYVFDHKLKFAEQGVIKREIKSKELSEVEA
jgi:hypothetical protein